MADDRFPQSDSSTTTTSIGKIGRRALSTGLGFERCRLMTTPRPIRGVEIDPARPNGLIVSISISNRWTGCKDPQGVIKSDEISTRSAFISTRPSITFEQSHHGHCGGRRRLPSERVSTSRFLRASSRPVLTPARQAQAPSSMALDFGAG